jgi:hypothetical protein
MLLSIIVSHVIYEEPHDSRVAKKDIHFFCVKS